jgi:DNA-binding transcriptional ArsR family regulator
MDKNILTGEVTQLHAELCGALSDPKRILMLYVLAEHTLNVSDLAEEVGISQPAASRHLRILRERGIVQAERQGSSVQYHLTDLRLIEALDLLRLVLRGSIAHRASLMEEEAV